MNQNTKNSQIYEPFNSAPKLAFGLVLLVVMYFLVSAGVLRIVESTPLLDKVYNDQYGRLFCVFLSVGLIHLILWPWLKWVHKTSYRELINCKSLSLNFRFAQIFLVLVFILSEPYFLLSNLKKIDFQFAPDFSLWLIWIVPYIFAIGIQVLAEEVFFRGYIQSSIAALTSRPLWIILIPAVLWTIPHWSNLNELHLKISFVTFIFVLAVVLGWVTYKSGSLIFAILFHLFLNIFTTCIYGNSFRKSNMLIIEAKFDILNLYWQTGYFLLVAFAILIIFALSKRKLYT